MVTAMRKILIVLPLLAAQPATAEPAPAPPPSIKLPPALTDPATADKLARTMDGLTQALLDLKVGEVQAAAEGREPSPEAKKLTVRDLARRDDPHFDRNLRRRVA